MEMDLQSCVALIGESNTEQMMSTMQKVVNSLEAWGKQIGLSFNALKTKVIMFSKATSIFKHLPNRLIIENHSVPFGHYSFSEINIWTSSLGKCCNGEN